MAFANPKIKASPKAVSKGRHGVMLLPRKLKQDVDRAHAKHLCSLARQAVAASLALHRVWSAFATGMLLSLMR